MIELVEAIEGAYRAELPSLSRLHGHCVAVAAIAFRLACDRGLAPWLATGLRHLPDGTATWHRWCLLPDDTCIDTIEHGKVRVSDGSDLELGGHVPKTVIVHRPGGGL